MRKVVNSSKLRKAVLATAAAVTALVAAPRSSSAATYTLFSNNSVVNINPFADASEPDGLFSWTVDGTTQAREQGYWFQVGSGAGTNIATLSPSVLVQPVQLLNTTGGNAGMPDFASVSYQGNGFTANTRYLLTGGGIGSNFSDLIETVVVTNVGSASLPFHMVDYTDLNLGGNGTNDSVAITDGGVITTQTNPAGWTGLATASPTNLTAYEAAAFPTLLNGLNSGTAFPLNDTSTLASTDVSNGVEYDANLAPGASLIFSVNQEIIGPTVPEPTSTALLGAGGLFLIRPRRRDEDADPRTAQVAGA